MTRQHTDIIRLAADGIIAIAQVGRRLGDEGGGGAVLHADDSLGIAREVGRAEGVDVVEGGFLRGGLAGRDVEGGGEDGG